jgi:hypothetical protein
MKIKVSEASGQVLDRLVNMAEELHFVLAPVAYSSNWSFGGPIIEGKEIQLATERGGEWVASIPCAVEIGDYRKYSSKTGPTPLIAAMRCYVVSKLGEEVEIPEEFI